MVHLFILSFKHLDFFMSYFYVFKKYGVTAWMELEGVMFNETS